MFTRLEFIEGTSSKFWQVKVDGNSALVTFGRIGTQGQEKPHTCGSPVEAKELAQSLIKEKVKKGYREVAPEAQPPKTREAPATPERKEKGKQEAAAPPPATRYVMMRNNDPEDTSVIIQAGGELLIDRQRVGFQRVGDATEHRERVMNVRSKSGYKLVSTEPTTFEMLETGENDDMFRCEVEGRKATFTCDEGLTKKIVERGLKRLETTGVESVRLRCELQSPGKHWQGAIEGRTFANVQSFVFDTEDQTQTRQQSNSIGDLAVTLRALPSVQNFWSTGKSDLSPVSHAALKTLVLLGNPLPSSTLRGLGQCEFAQLTSLTIALASDAAPVKSTTMNAALKGLNAPLLSEVFIDGGTQLEDTLEALCMSAFAENLKSVTLIGTCDEAALLETVRRHLTVLQRLQVFALPIRDDISDETEAAIRALISQLGEAEATDELLPARYENW